jgi:serine/threonine protein kinase KIN1/2
VAAPRSSRPRPVSMPPQSYATEKEKQYVEDGKQHRSPREAIPGKPSRTTNRLLGDYTLSKTLGAGSMGKVKLATHNITGEKVRPYPFSLRMPLNLTVRVASLLACCQDTS